MAQRWLLVTRFYLTFAFRGHRSQPSNPDSYLVPAPSFGGLRSASSAGSTPSNRPYRAPSMAAPALPLANHAAATATATARYLHRNHQLLQPKRQLPPGFLAARPLRQPRRPLSAVPETKEEEAKTADEITEKYGLEVGLWKYGGAYLATSITLSLISFTACYLLINAGVDVQQLLGKIGIATDETGGKVGTFALAYAAHKAASPIRFPPTVALTPVVANWIGKIAKGGEGD
ncbi:hypothetical protein ZWY2020_051213 [Hordeum vulgare]|nr:hypothetical protein ZWY2020_051213 [Hordeum vulgare]